MRLLLQTLSLPRPAICLPRTFQKRKHHIRQLPQTFLAFPMKMALHLANNREPVTPEKTFGFRTT